MSGGIKAANSPLLLQKKIAKAIVTIGSRLPDFNRIQAKINEMASTMTLKQISPYQAGVPAL